MTDYEAIIDILLNESSITDKVAKLINNAGGDTAFPAIVFGDLADNQVVYPVISLRRLTKDKLNGIETGFFICDCWAESMTESTDLAEAVDELFTDSFCFASDYAFKSTSDIISTVSDGVYNNTPVNIKVTYIRR